jgi:succinate dehydrogenase/fumarate reductase-like Fe-S protein
MMIRIQRDAEQPAETYDLPDTLDGQAWSGLSIISAFSYIQQNFDPDFAYAVSCGRGTCNVCLVRIGGEVVTACTTPVTDGMLINPTRSGLVIRDMVIELSLVRKSRL